MISLRCVRSVPTREFSSAASIPSPNRESFNMTSQLHRAKSDVGRVLHLSESNVASRPSHPQLFLARVDFFALRRILHPNLTAPSPMSRRVLRFTESNVTSRPSHPRVFFSRVDSLALRRILHYDLTAPHPMSRQILPTLESSSAASIPSANDESFITT